MEVLSSSAVEAVEVESDVVEVAGDEVWSASGVVAAIVVVVPATVVDDDESSLGEQVIPP